MEDILRNQDALTDLLLTAKEKQQLVKVFNAMKDFQSVMLELQRSTLTIGTVRTLFDGLRGKYPALKRYITASAAIIHSPLFEAALVKLERKEALTDEERAVVAALEVFSSFLSF